VKVKVPRAVVFLGGSASETELIQAFRRSGLHVVLVDRNAHAPGREFADEFVNLSVTEAGPICDSMEALRSRYCFIAAYGNVDYMFETVRALTVRLGIKLNPPEIYREFTDKLRTKARCKRFDVPVPKTILQGRKFDESMLQRLADAAACRTVIIKASDSCNSEGVRMVRADQRGAVRQAIAEAIELSGEFMCEEYIGGTLHNLDVILSAGGARIVAITDRYRMADGITSIAGLQQGPRQHPQYVRFAELAAKTQRMFADYSGPLTGDIMNSDGRLTVLEMSPHLHAAKLQWLRDPDLLDLWPRALVGRSPESDGSEEGCNASAYVRIYGNQETYLHHFDRKWIAAEEEFRVPRRFGEHELHKILYLKSESAEELRRCLEAFVHESGGLSPANSGQDGGLRASM
jgi:ATP-grasp domain